MSRPFDAPALHSLLRTYEKLLSAHEDEINALNVFPVADGDTGTNMLSTVRGVVEALGEGDIPLDDMRASASRAALRSARGSSGIIFCQWLRGFLGRLPEGDSVGTSDLAAALAAASDAAYAAVEDPVEGTILTVARTAAEAAASPDDRGAEGEGGDIWTRAGRAADHAVERSPEILPVLGRAGVVDSGARALALVFDAANGAPVGDIVLTRPPQDVDVAIHLPDESHAYEVTFLLGASSAAPLLEAWRKLGDAIVVAGDAADGTWRCHIHTDDPDAAIEAGSSVGPIENVRIEALPGGCSDPTARPGHDHVCTGMVAVTVGSGLATRMRELGSVVVECTRTMNASIGEVAEAIGRSPGETVLVLPGDPDTVAACEAACELADRPAHVLAVTSLAGVLDCVEVYDPTRAPGENSAAMLASAHPDPAPQARWFEIAAVVRSAETRVGPVDEGDWILIGTEGVVHVADDPIGAARQGLGMLGRTDRIEIYPGRQASAELTDRLLALLHSDLSHAEVVLREGGQPYQAWLLRVPATAASD